MSRSFDTIYGSRLIISAPHKSSGKTMVATGLIAALSQSGLVVAPFKKGLDFIDPMWLTAAAGGRQCHNLDFFVMTPDQIKRSLWRHSREANFCLIEGNLGYFDGQDAEGIDSTAGLADLLKTPAILVIDCRGMARSIAPLLYGHRFFPENPGGHYIDGVILNRVASPRHEKRLLQSVRDYVEDVEVVGVLPNTEEMAIDERHMGLVPTTEQQQIDDRIGALGRFISDHVNLSAVRDIASRARLLSIDAETVPTVVPSVTARPLTIAYAADAAFHFYYSENLEAITARGVQLQPINLLQDSQLPAMDGLYIGGGFPEMFMEALAANRILLEAMRRAIEAGLPVYAECGGLMLLAQRLHWQQRSVALCGALPIDVEMCPRPQGYGYMTLSGTNELSWPPPQTTIPCHEFHYSRLRGLPDQARFAYRVERGTGIDGQHDGLIHRRVLASYAHIHHQGAPGWADFLLRFWSGDEAL
ncbi:MAG: cobyrinate a,c-diamide synthase [Magnetococcales bacterium]|nr:cobyrinate a,c-diamide synthase [Magnetococcales bacterium]